MKLPALPLAVLSLSLFAAPAVSEPMTSEEARQIVQRALPYLTDSQDKEFKSQISGNQCLSCHWSGAAIFGLSNVRRHGLIESKELDKFQGLLQRISSKKLIYQLNEPTMQYLKTAEVPEEKLTALKKQIGIGKKFDKPEDMQRELGKVLAPELVAQHQAELLKLAADPDHYDTVSPLMASTMLVAGGPAMTKAPGEVTKGLVDQLLRTQQKDGSCNEIGQPLFPCEPGERLECYTTWSVLALLTVEPKSEDVAQALERAQAFLKTTKPAKSTVTVVMRLLLAHRLKDAPRVAELSAELRKQQRPDGGWSIWNWSKGDYDSDAWATGAALYALGVTGCDRTDEGVQHAWAFLLKTQEKNGRWTVTNTKESAARIWTYWGTSWAVVGILETSR
jgi:hypothetical protein